MPIFVSVVTLQFDRKTHAFVGVELIGVTQAWYESGGVVAQGAILMLTSSLVTDLLRYIHFPALFQRYVLGKFAASQIRLNQLWAPPRMPLGGIYAETFRSICVGMVYAPIYPPAFLITSFAMFGNLLSTRWAIATWYMRPPLVDGQLMKRMRNFCVWLLLPSCLVVATVTGAQSWQGREALGMVSQALPALLVGFLLWLGLLLLGPLLSRSRYFSTKFQHEEESELWHSRNSQRNSQRNSRSSQNFAGGIRQANIRYCEVLKKFGYIMERYECPAASRAKSSRHLEDTAFRQGFTGGFVDAGNAKVLEQSTGGSFADGSFSDSTSAGSRAGPPSLASIVSDGNNVEHAEGSSHAMTGVGEASSGTDGRESSVDEDDLFFPSVALPMAPEPWGSRTASTSPRGASAWAAAREGLLRRGTGGTSPASRSGFTFASRDPVITHLNSALAELSRVLVELGGEAIPPGDDQKRMQRAERRVQRRLNGGESRVRAQVAASDLGESHFLSDSAYFAPVQPAIETRAWRSGGEEAAANPPAPSLGQDLDRA